MTTHMMKIIVTFSLAIGLISLAVMYNQKVVELEKNKQLIQDTFNPVMECIQYSHFSVNGKDMGYGYHISDYGLLGFDCDRRVGEALHKYLEEVK